MPELKLELIRLIEGQPYTPGPDEYVVTENHTLHDIIRFCIQQGDIQDVLELVIHEVHKRIVVE